MPELPEVETVVRDLRPLLTGRRVGSVEVIGEELRHPWLPEWDGHLVGRRITDIHRHGKWITVDLQRGYLDLPRLVFHLGMTGQLTVVSAREPLASHTHLVFGLERGTRQLRFRDIRRFGSAQLFDVDSYFRYFEGKLGADALVMPASYFRERLAAAKRPLKAILLDQRIVAGVGNIYADEALFQAELHPARLGRDLSGAEADRLKRAIVTVLNRAITKRGSSIRDYLDGRGEKGQYQAEFRVYGRTGAPCPRCGSAIQRVRLAGRSTHFCPRCQSND
jgi:formamidopyrimidine-DNA glycosylase